MNIRLRLRFGFIGALLLLLGIGVISQYRLKLSMDSAAWVTKTYEVLTELQGLSSAVHIAQRDERSYLLTHDPKLEARFRDGQRRVMVLFTRVRYLAAVNPRQQRRLDRLKPLVDRLFVVSFAPEGNRFRVPR